MKIVIEVKLLDNTEIKSNFLLETKENTMADIADKIETAIIEVAAKKFEIAKINNQLCKIQK